MNALPASSAAFDRILLERLASSLGLEDGAELVEHLVGERHGCVARSSFEIITPRISPGCLQVLRLVEWQEDCRSAVPALEVDVDRPDGRAERLAGGRRRRCRPHALSSSAASALR